MTVAVAPRDQERYSQGFATTVRRTRQLLWWLLVALLVVGTLTTLVSLAAAQRTLDDYRAIVEDSARSADAAQAARAALLTHHREAATFLSTSDESEAADALARSEAAWLAYQEPLREIWQNRSDREFGEFEVFAAADRATWRYRSDIDAMKALAAVNDDEGAREAFVRSHQRLVRELMPALNGIEELKLERMEERYLETRSGVDLWRNALVFIGGALLVLMLLAVVATRIWLHYAWTWEIAIALVVGILLFAWFNISLLQASSQVDVLVRRAYDTIANVQAVESLLSQADALESMAIFDPSRADEFLSDGDEYLFLLEQRICGELACTDQPFAPSADPDRLLPEIRALASEGQGKYGLPRPPLAVSADFEGEAIALENLRSAVRRFRLSHERLRDQIASGAVIDESESRAAFSDAVDAVGELRGVARARFTSIFSLITGAMQLNRLLALLFVGLGALGAVGLYRRRQALFG